MCWTLEQTQQGGFALGQVGMVKAYLAALGARALVVEWQAGEGGEEEGEEEEVVVVVAAAVEPVEVMDFVEFEVRRMKLYLVVQPEPVVVFAGMVESYLEPGQPKASRTGIRSCTVGIDTP